jgi:sporulation protein YqfC
MLEKWLDRLDLADEPVPGRSVVEIVGCERVLIEKHSGVIQYGDQMICVRATYGIVRICGSCLELTQMTRYQLIISGCIHCVQLERSAEK